MLFPEYAAVKGGAKLLAASAHVGMVPRENLHAAARLAALIGQEPVLIASLVSVAAGRIALREARRQGLAREIEGLLGPPLDVRRTYAFEFYGALQTMRLLGTEGYDRKLYGRARETDWFAHLHQTGPWRDNALRRYIVLWRDLWREMPKNGTDYAGAARAIRRHTPLIDRAAGDYDEVLATYAWEPGDDPAQAVVALSKYAAERKAARAGG